ncbi:MAG: ATP-binding protein [Candidatus Pacebacteria bacterium]|nr:ATP-binding protein [Candidatus Paceibacterota bacterium]
MSLQIQEQIKYFDRVYDLESLLKPQKALVLYGPRQIGKTTLLQALIKKTRLKKFQGTGDDLRLKTLFSEPDFDGLISFAKDYELIIIDEAQNIPNIGLGLKIIIDHVENIKIIVTGSASFELAGQIGEPLVGRKRTYTLFPLSVLELSKYYTPYQLENELLEQLLLFGCYPEVLTAETNKEKREALMEITNLYLLKDVLALEKIKSPKILRDLLQLLAWQIGNEVSLTELSNSLNIDYKTVARYLDLLEKVFVIVSVRGFSRNLRKEVTKKNKYFFLDIGIRNAIIENFNTINLRNDIGQLWENFVFLERMKTRDYKQIYANQYFWRTWEQQEIDLIEERDGQLFAYEFKWNDKKKIKTPKQWTDNYKNSEFKVITPKNYQEFVL